MTFLAFLLGLALGIGIWLWQKRRLQRQLGQMLGTLQRDATSPALPVVSRLRREIAIANEHREMLEAELQIKQWLFQVAPLGYLQVDEENQLVWCNEQARQLLHIDRWEPGQLRLLLELVRSYELDQLIEKTRHQQQPNIREWVFHPSCLDGAAMGDVQALTLRASSWPLPEGQIGVFLENRQPLVELSQSRNQWFSDLAHELRTPLTSIRLVAEALQGRLEPPASRWVEKLLHETNRLINLVQDWLELSNLEKNPSKSLTYQPVELRALIHSAWQTFELLAQTRQLTLAYKGPDITWIRADEARLTQVFLNLLDNSIKHSHPQQAIQVEVTQLEEDANTPTTSNLATSLLDERSCVQIDIIDSGTGFSETDMPHVFERLYRGDDSRHKEKSTSEHPSRSSVSKGSGLGLAIVQQIIQAHGGSIKARNHPKTGGAWLQIKLPQGKASL
ncbi:MAG: HAMP domain-containing histidine kinase [Microcoleus sp. SIO2G3]|nr:HAMP domain-containing histidine kinase [Microcoleus sp. SIO2G3]